MSMKKQKAVVLLSGGLDSTTALRWAQDQGFLVHALTINYGQRHQLEIEAAQRITKQAGVAKHLILEADMRAFGGSALTSNIEVPAAIDLPSQGSLLTYVPARNTIFLAYALACAEALEASPLVVGANLDDIKGYPDCRPEYLKAFEHLASLATWAGVEKKQRMKICAPLSNLSKAEVVKLALQLDVPFASTWSCYDPSPEEAPCQQCSACTLRQDAFIECGLIDPIQRPQTLIQKTSPPLQPSHQLVSSPVQRATNWHEQLVIITGAGGFIGAALADDLLSRGAKVVGIDRKWGESDPVRRERYEKLINHANFQALTLDLCSTSSLIQALHGLEGAVIFHLAARAGVRDTHITEILLDNVEATKSLLTALAQFKPAQVIFASSSSVYGLQAPLPFIEQGPLGRQTSDYARSKIQGENFIKQFHKTNDVPVSIARLFNVYGPRGRHDMAPAIFTRKLLGREAITLAAAGAVERDLTYIDDVVEGFRRLAERDLQVTPQTIMNIGTGQRHSMSALLSLLESKLGICAVRLHGPSQACDLPATQASQHHTKTLLGWAPSIKLDCGVEKLLAWTLGDKTRT